MHKGCETMISERQCRFDRSKWRETERGALGESSIQDRRRTRPKHSTRFRRHLYSLVLLFSFIGYLSPQAFCAEWKIIPKLGVAGGYDDNVNYTNTNKTHSSIVDIKPGIELNYKTLLSSVQMRADFDVLRYLDQHDLDRENQYYRLKGSHRFSERWDTRGGFRFFRDTTLNTYLNETGRLTQQVNRDYYYATGGVSYDLTQLSSIDADYRFSRAQYEGDVFPSYNRHQVFLTYRHRLKNQIDTISIGPSYYHRTNNINDSDYTSLDFGWKRDWSEITNTFLSIGPRYSIIKYKNGNSNDYSWGAIARFRLNHKGIASKTTFQYYHDLATIADGVDVNVDNFYLIYDYLLTARFGMGIDGRLVFSYGLSNTQNNQTNVHQRRYYMVEPFIYYRLSENLKAYLRYSYQNSSDKPIKSENASERNRVWLELSYELPMMP